MKRQALYTLLAFVLLACVFTFVGCKDDDHTHSFNSETVSPTCTKEGYTLYTCSCGATYKEDILPALGHNYVNGVCVACGNIASNDGDHTHSYSAETVSPTCTEDGYTVYTCGCGDTYTSDGTAALGHSYVDGICTTCGYVTPVETSAEYFTFTLLEDGTYSIKAKNKDNMPSEVVIPSTYEGKAVTAIAEGAFYGCDSLTSVIIPDSVTSIGNWAFDCTAYYENEDNWVNKVLYIGNYLIDAKTNISGEYVIEKGTKCIAYRAFEGCSSLTSVTVPGSVASVGSYAFYDCDSLTSVHISDMTSWCSISFSDYYSNPLHCADNLYLNGELVTELVISDSVTSIGNWAFAGCSSLTSVTIPDSVTSIGSSAFFYNWYDSESLTSVHISDLSSWCNISFSDYRSNPLYCANNLYLNGELVTDLVIPDSVTSIGEYAFYSCGSLVNVTIPDSVTSIGDEAFYSCDSLTSVTIGNGVTSIGDEAFYSCDSLTSVTIGNGVTSIGNQAFTWCDSLASVTIGNGVTSIGSEAFAGIFSLARVHISDLSSWCNISFSDYRSNPLYCANNLYLNGELVTDLVIPDGVTSIGDYAFDRCYDITYVYYAGSPSEWKKINGIGDLGRGTIYFYGIHYDVWGVIGTICGTNWDTDFLMTQESEYVWISDPIKMNAGDEFKVRKNWNWEDNFGANGIVDGENIVVDESGTYKIKLFYNGSYATIEMIKVSD